MKIDKQKLHLKRNQEARRENSHIRVTHTLLTPTEKDSTLHLRQEAKMSSYPVTAQPVRDCHNSPMKRHYTFNFKFPQWILHLKQPLQIP